MIKKTFADLGYTSIPERRMLPWIHVELQEKTLDKIYLFGYDGYIHIYEVEEMRKKYYFEIPYGYRSKWVERCWNLNKLVETKGIFELYICNIPYHLRACVFFDYEGNGDDILQFCEKNEISLSYEKGSEEFYQDMKNRLWNVVTFPYELSLDDFRYLFEYFFEYIEIDELNKLGYHWEQEAKRKKVFISYSWNDQSTVYDVVKQLQQSGINLFIDAQSINYGDHILEKVLSGLDESDMSIFFISQSFVKSSMAKNEMKSVWTKVIYGKKEWMIVKLDDVNPEDIFFSLSDYKYFDYQKENVEDLIKAVHKKLESL